MNVAPNTQNGAGVEKHMEKIRRFPIISRKRFTYDEILALLDQYHGTRMSIGTLKRRIKEYGLKRRNLRYDLNSVRRFNRTGNTSTWHLEGVPNMSIASHALHGRL